MSDWRQEDRELRQLIERIEDSLAREREKATQLEQALSELKRTQAKLIQAEKMSSLGRMVAGVVYEINGPLGFIHGNLTHTRAYCQDLLKLIQLYQQTYPNPTPEIQHLTSEIDLDFLVEDSSKLIDLMQLGAERIQQIVRSLRSFSRLHDSELKLVDIHEIIDNALLILQRRLKPVGIAKGRGQTAEGRREKIDWSRFQYFPLS